MLQHTLLIWAQRLARSLMMLLAIFLLVACTVPSVVTENVVTEEPMEIQSDQDQQAIVETTVLHLEDGWDIGVQMIYQGEYVDAAGNAQKGMVARISVIDGVSAETLTVYVGAEFEAAGTRYQVVDIQERPSSGLPGGSQSFMVISKVS
jgi:hypothetical protein